MSTYFNETGAKDVGDCLPCTPGSYCGTDGLSYPTGLCESGWYFDIVTHLCGLVMKESVISELRTVKRGFRILFFGEIEKNHKFCMVIPIFRIFQRCHLSYFCKICYFSLKMYGNV